MASYNFFQEHYNDAIMSTMASDITSLTIVYSTVYIRGVDQRKHQSSASLAFVRGIHRSPVNSPHKGPVTRKCFHLMTPSCWDIAQGASGIADIAVHVLNVIVLFSLLISCWTMCFPLVTSGMVQLLNTDCAVIQILCLYSFNNLNLIFIEYFSINSWCVLFCK